MSLPNNYSADSYISIATEARNTTCKSNFDFEDYEVYRNFVLNFLRFPQYKLQNMDADGLHLSIDYVGSSGIILSTEQKAALQSSLVILKSNYKFKRVLFWGKILGVKNDYFIVQGVGKDDLKEIKSLYSQDCVKWGLLPAVTDIMQKNCSYVKGRFTGDPSYEYEHIEVKKTEEEKDGEKIENEEENTILIKEEDRLATVINNIDNDVRIVPRGAFLRTAKNEVFANRSFEGLNVADSGKLTEYFHFREPVLLYQKSILQKAELDKALDFLDPIDADIPRGGSWSVQFERGSGLVTLRSLHWIGYTFYHVPCTKNYGSVYFGTGEKNLDLPFML